MKKCLMVIAGVLAGTVLAVSEDSTILTFSTVGPDRYADGTVVRNGERYAIVWRTGDTAVAFNADGSLTETDEQKAKLLYAGPLAKDGRCPETRFVIDGDFRDSLGNYVICLLDTRKYGAEGEVTIPGAGWRVQGFVQIANAVVGFSAVTATVPPSPTFAASALPPELEVPEQPSVAAIVLDESGVHVVVSNTSDYVNYTLQSADTLEESAFSVPADLKPRTGAETTDGTVEFSVVRDPAVPRRFYRVIRHPLK